MLTDAQLTPPPTKHMQYNHSIRNIAMCRTAGQLEKSAQHARHQETPNRLMFSVQVGLPVSIGSEKEIIWQLLKCFGSIDWTEQFWENNFGIKISTVVLSCYMLTHLLPTATHLLNTCHEPVFNFSCGKFESTELCAKELATFTFILSLLGAAFGRLDLFLWT